MMKVASSVIVSLSLLGSSVIQAAKDDSYYIAGTGNPNVNEKMYWKDAENVLQDLSKFSALYVTFDSCAWTWMQTSDPGNDVEENDYWYMGKIPPFGANVAYSLYGQLKGSNWDGCGQDTFINSFYTNSGFTDFARAMKYTGLSGFSSYAGYSYSDDDNSYSSSSSINAECKGGYGVGCDYSNGFAVHYYSGKGCDPQNVTGVKDKLSSLNSAMKKAQCIKIYDSSKNSYGYTSGTGLELLEYSHSCFYQDYFSPDGECPDPYGKLKYYQNQFHNGIQESKKWDPYQMELQKEEYLDTIEKGKITSYTGIGLAAVAFIIFLWDICSSCQWWSPKRKQQKFIKEIPDGRPDEVLLEGVDATEYRRTEADNGQYYPPEDDAELGQNYAPLADNISGVSAEVELVDTKSSVEEAYGYAAILQTTSTFDRIMVEAFGQEGAPAVQYPPAMSVPIVESIKEEETCEMMAENTKTDVEGPVKEEVQSSTEVMVEERAPAVQDPPAMSVPIFESIKEEQTREVMAENTKTDVEGPVKEEVQSSTEVMVEEGDSAVQYLSTMSTDLVENIQEEEPCKIMAENVETDVEEPAKQEVQSSAEVKVEEGDSAVQYPSTMSTHHVENIQEEEPCEIMAENVETDAEEPAKQEVAETKPEQNPIPQVEETVIESMKGEGATVELKPEESAVPQDEETAGVSTKDEDIALEWRPEETAVLHVEETVGVRTEDEFIPKLDENEGSVPGSGDKQGDVVTEDCVTAPMLQEDVTEGPIEEPTSFTGEDLFRSAYDDNMSEETMSKDISEIASSESTDKSAPPTKATDDAEDDEETSIENAADGACEPIEEAAPSTVQEGNQTASTLSPEKDSVEIVRGHKRGAENEIPSSSSSPAEEWIGVADRQDQATTAEIEEELTSSEERIMAIRSTKSSEGNSQQDEGPTISLSTADTENEARQTEEPEDPDSMLATPGTDEAAKAASSSVNETAVSVAEPEVALSLENEQEPGNREQEDNVSAEPM